MVDDPVSCGGLTLFIGMPFFQSLCRWVVWMYNLYLYE
jgi:hypothetical protein